MAEHPSIDELAKLVDAAPRGENFAPQTLRHLLSGCSSCSSLLQAIAASKGMTGKLSQLRASAAPSPSAIENQYDAAFTKAEKTLAFFMAGGHPVQGPPPELLAELAPLAMEGHNSALNARQLAIPSLVKWLVQRSHEHRYEAPEQMLHWALMARLAADCCSTTVARSRQRLDDLKGFAGTQLGTALRVAGRHQEAQDTLTEAERLLAEGTGDLSLRARFFVHTASLHIAQRNFGDAFDLLRESGQIWEDIGEMSSLGHILVAEAVAHVYDGAPDRAVEPLLRALRFIDMDDDPGLGIASMHNLARCYIDLGKPEAALTLHQRTQDIKGFQRPLIMLRAAWQKGLLLRQLGRFEEAAEVFFFARNGFAKRKLAHEVAFLTRDLITAYKALGQDDMICQIVGQTLSLLQTLPAGADALRLVPELSTTAPVER